MCRGVCGNCKNTLRSVHITQREFELVRKEFMEKVVKGGDIYQKTTPEEWQRFERVIEENRPFDIVMDGLNVAFMSNKQNGYLQMKSPNYGQNVTHRHKRQKPCAFGVCEKKYSN